MSVTLTMDKASADHLNKQFDLLREAGPRSVYSAIVKVAYKIATTAKLRLKGKGHIVTSRLTNSIFVKTEKKASETYSFTGGNATSELLSVTLGKDEVAIGTNTEYAQKIEDLDSYLGWAVQNIDITKSIGDEAKPTLENAMKFGIKIIPAER